MAGAIFHVGVRRSTNPHVPCAQLVGCALVALPLMGGTTFAGKLARRGWSAAIVVSACALAACGGGEESTADTTSAAPTTAVTTTVNASSNSDGSRPPVDGTSTAGTTTTNSSPVVDTEVAESTSVVTTTIAAMSGGLSLERDGLGVVQFGTDLETTVATLTATIGAPSALQAAFQDTGSTSRAGANWDGLVITFTGPVDGPLAFWAYEFGRVHEVDSTGALTEGDLWVARGWQSATATSDGIAPATPVASVAGLHPTVYLPDCGRALQPSSLLGGAGSPGQALFLEPSETGLFVRIAGDGTVFSVGAQASPNLLACDGG